MRDSEGRVVAHEALEHYDLAPKTVALAAESFNTVFRVATATGTYALRVGPEEIIYATGTHRVEAAWLSRLHANGLAAPVVVPNRAGQPETAIVAHDGSGVRACVLFEWVRGRTLASRLTGSGVRRLGGLAARLHADAGSWGGQPQGVLTADRVLYWHLPRALPRADDPDGPLFEEALERTEADLAELWRHPPHPPHLLHGDLTPRNVLVTPTQGLVPIDFEDLVVGFDVQDLAISVDWLERMADRAGTVDTVRLGYEEHRPWPDIDPRLFESLVFSRRLHTMNLTLNFLEPPEHARYLAERAPRFREWMGRG